MAEPENGAMESPNIPEEQKKYWIPFSLRRPALMSLAALLLILAVACEFIRSYSNCHQGLIHLNTYRALGLTAGLFVYVPTGLAVLVVALWNICTLDVLRLEPYFQLAKPEGTSGAALFTNYCFSYGILAPIRAFRNKHWIVLVVSSVSLIMRTMLPSLLSGLIVLEDKNIVTAKPINTWPTLVNLETQSTWLASEASYSRNNSIFHANTFFFYQTYNYAMPPIVRLPEDDTESSTWKMNQTAYWADMKCVDISMNGIVPERRNFNSTSSSLGWNVSNVQFDHLPSGSADSCTINFTLESHIPTGNGPFQVRHWEPLNPNATIDASDTMHHTQCESFALFGIAINVGPSFHNFSSNATAFGCTSSYLNSSTEIIFPTNTSFVTAEHVSGPVKTLNSSQLSISSFESLIYAKYISGNLVTPNDRLQIPSLTTFTGVNKTLISDLTPANTTDYQEDITRLWNHHFINTMNRFFNTTGNPRPVISQQSTETVLYQVTSRSALITEGILLAGFALLLVLAYIYPLRPNFLLADPGSIAAQCAILTDKFSRPNLLMQTETGFQRATPRRIRQFARTLWCEWIDTPDGKRIDITTRERTPAPLESPKARLRRNPKPHFLNLPWFLIECAVMAIVLGAFGVAFQLIRLDKIDYDTTGANIIYFFLIYGPTIIASMISTLYISIYRHLSNLEPWVRLQKGMAPAKQSLSVNYGSQTPVTSWRTFRPTAPPILVLLSAMCFLDFFLTIASSGMFEPQIYNSTVPTSALFGRYNQSRFLKPDVQMAFSGNSFIFDGLITGYSLLAWTTPNTSFFPLRVDINDKDPDYFYEDYQARTRGVSANLQCKVIPSSDSWQDRVAGNTYWSYKPYQDLDTTCTAKFQRPAEEYRLFNDSVYFRASMNSTEVCEKSFVVITYGDIENENTIFGANSTIFYCAPEIQLQDFDVIFDFDGMIDDWSPVAGTSITTGEMFHNASASLVPFTSAFLRQTQSSGHNQALLANHYDWAVVLTRQVYNTLTSNEDPFHPSILIQAVELSYQSTYSNHFTLWRDIYLGTVPKNAVPIRGTATDTYWVIEPSNHIVIIIIVFLSLDLSVLMAVFWLRHKHYNGPQAPTSCGALIPWITQSRILSDVRGTSAWNEAKRCEHLNKLDKRYRYGEFKMSDGSSRLALDHDFKTLDEADERDYEMDELSVHPPHTEWGLELEQSPETHLQIGLSSAATSTAHLIPDNNDRS